MDTNNSILYDKNTIEFVTVAASFCSFLESIKGLTKEDFVDKALKILPLLYLKAQLIPPIERLNDENVEVFVTEEAYNSLRNDIAALLEEMDDYLEVFMPDMQYSDTPILATVSEDLSDIYQYLKDFIFAFQSGLAETMNDALCICKENFSDYWGQRLVNTLRALHTISKQI